MAPDFNQVQESYPWEKREHTASESRGINGKMLNRDCEEAERWSWRRAMMQGTHEEEGACKLARGV